MAFFKPRQAPPPIVEDPAAQNFGYVEPPPVGSNFMDRYRYVNQTNPSALMAIGAGLMRGDVGGGFAAAAEEMQQGADLQQRAKEKLWLYQEGLRKDNLTKEWLRGKYPDASEAELDAAVANPTILSDLINPPKRNLIEVDGQLYDADTDTWISPGGAEGGGALDLGSGESARALEYLVTIGKLTNEQAAEIAAGKVVTDENGRIIFMGASDLAGNPQLMVQEPGKEPVPIKPDTAAPTAPDVTTQPASPAEAPAAPTLQQPGGGAGQGGTVLTGPKPDPETVKTKASLTRLQRSLDEQLTVYTDLVDKYGIEAVEGSEGKLAIDSVRTGIVMDVKALLELGVLNKGDLPQINKMIYDPTVNLGGEEGGIGTSLSQAWTGITGTAGDKARASATQLREYLDSKVRAFEGKSKPGAAPVIRTQAEFNALPKDTVYIDASDGKRYRKP